MRIDIHAHTFPDKIAAKAVHSLQSSSHTAPFSDGTAAGLRENEKKAGIDLAVVQPVATYPEQVASINSHVIEEFCGNPPEGLLSFAAMHPCYEKWEEELERISAFGLPGIKLHPPYEGVNVDHPSVVRILKKCRDLDLIVLIHSGWDVGLPGHTEALPAKIRRALDAAGPIKLIAAHMAGWKCWEEAADLLSDTGIFLDTSFSLGTMTPAQDRYVWKEDDLRLLTDAGFCDLVHRFGSDHVLFGTDSPWADPSTELNKIRSLPLSCEEVDAICGRNARQLLGIR